MTEKEFLRAVKQADLRYFREAAERAEDASQEYETEGRHMKTKKVIAFAAIAAALSAGGVTAAVAMHGHNVRTETSQTEEITTTQNETTQLPIEEKKTLGLHLTDDYTSPYVKEYSGMGREYSLVQSDTGWYYIKKLDNTEEMRAQLYYTNAQTGESLPLCQNPQCKHDGNLYCTASTKAYYEQQFTWADGSLWCVAKKSTNPDEYDTAAYYEKSHTVLLEYAPDGSSIREAADFGETNSGFSYPIYYRGYLFFYVSKQIGDTLVVDNPMIEGQYQMLKTIGYELIAYDLKEKKATVVYSLIPEAGSNEIWHFPDWFCGAGDDIYFYEMENDWQLPYQNGLYRISLLTGEMSEVSRESIITMSSDAILFRAPTPESAGKADKEYEAHLKLLNSDEETALKQLGIRSTFYTFMDDRYIYQSDYDSETEVVSINIYDRTGKTLGKASLTKNTYVNFFQVHNGSLLVMTKGKISTMEDGGTRWEMDTVGEVYTCSIQDVLNGTYEWKKQFCLDEIVHKGKDE